ncbi:hypothetical protein LTR66_000260 [Elasticomyces elasticus]|nr:hypothetical protein LTR28_004492 [Elasticomyces elasticus]KAK5000981.1 hypothetical protein LTR66_000260 [Elasticomyces elasticus]
MRPTALNERLDELGLGRYKEALFSNGFNSWDALHRITEADMGALGLKLGHRRILQREIAKSLEYRDVYGNASTPASSISPTPQKSPTRGSFTASVPREGKRRYRHRPCPDSHAPKRPKTAYVLFSDHLRTDSAISSMPFVQIAQEVGRRWKVMPPDQKSSWELRATVAVQEYQAAMSLYIQTPEYRAYQAYLAEFKMKQDCGNAIKPRQNGSGSNSQRKVPRDANGRHAIAEYFTGIAAKGRNSYDWSRASTAVPSAPTATINMDQFSTHSPPGLMETLSQSPHSPDRSIEDDGLSEVINKALHEVSVLYAASVPNGAATFSRRNLPPKDMTVRAMNAFLAGTGSLFFFWTPLECEEIIARAYSGRACDTLAVAEVLAMCAVGAHYDNDSFDDHLRFSIHRSCILSLGECMDASYTRGLRILSCLCVYALLEKDVQAERLTQLSVQAARWKLASTAPHPETVPTTSDIYCQNHLRVFRTLIFIQCWLSFALGRQADLHAHDVYCVEATYAIVPTTLEEDIQIQTCKIGLLAVEIAQDFINHNLGMSARNHLQKLDEWHQHLPPVMQLASLARGATPHYIANQRHSILLVHLLYLGTLLISLRRTISQATDGGPDPVIEPIPGDEHFSSQVAEYQKLSFITARQMTRIILLLQSDASMPRRCWLVCSMAFSAIPVLLYSAAYKLIRDETDDLKEDLDYANDCIDFLRRCSDVKSFTSEFISICGPLYQALLDLYSAKHINAHSRSSTTALCDPASWYYTPALKGSNNHIVYEVEDDSKFRVDRMNQWVGDSSQRSEELAITQAIWNLLESQFGMAGSAGSYSDSLLIPMQEDFGPAFLSDYSQSPSASWCG